MLIHMHGINTEMETHLTNRNVKNLKVIKIV